VVEAPRQTVHHVADLSKHAHKSTDRALQNSVQKIRLLGTGILYLVLVAWALRVLVESRKSGECRVTRRSAHTWSCRWNESSVAHITGGARAVWTGPASERERVERCKSFVSTRAGRTTKAVEQLFARHAGREDRCPDSKWSTRAAALETKASLRLRSGRRTFGPIDVHPSQAEGGAVRRRLASALEENAYSRWQ
jgi:hypothetical protein